MTKLSAQGRRLGTYWNITEIAVLGQGTTLVSCSTQVVCEGVFLSHPISGALGSVRPEVLAAPPLPGRGPRPKRRPGFWSSDRQQECFSSRHSAPCQPGPPFRGQLSPGL